MSTTQELLAAKAETEALRELIRLYADSLDKPYAHPATWGIADILRSFVGSA